MFSVFYEDGHMGIEIKSTGQRWFIEYGSEVSAFVSWLNEHAAQHSVQAGACPECLGKKYLGSQWMPRPCDACNSTGKRQ